jgi:carboxylesterase
MAALAAGNFAALRDMAIPDMTWVQPGTNRVAGAHTGKKYASFAARIAETFAPRFTAVGNPVFNRGVALVPATLAAAAGGATLQSQGALLFAFHGGKLLEARWFADEVEREDAFFGAPDPESSGPSQLEAAFEDAAAASKTLRKAPDNDTLLALYSLYKQAGAGDVTGERPGALDMINRAKYDAWAKRRGTSRDEAMKAYVDLVTQLRQDEARPSGS